MVRGLSLSAAAAADATASPLTPQTNSDRSYRVNRSSGGRFAGTALVVRRAVHAAHRTIFTNASEETWRQKLSRKLTVIYFEFIPPAEA
ncbi:hypothetical protein [Halorhabdus rudnickae]|uniref:hypothetical protein n=1 Tax=Halorhabdus rudnickae TaxID=1775544 RepID=UPI001AEF7CD5|nr:hypothetical protein [Halorhabdus rudnickae]